VEGFINFKTKNTSRRHEYCALNTYRQLPPRMDSLGATINSQDEEPIYFIRKALFVDMSPAADILTAGFFSEKTNFVTYQFEKLKTYLSLESSFPKPSETHEMIVACRNTDGKVLALAEVDGRPSNKPDAAPRPYMCNLAVDQVFRKMGIASELIMACEEEAIAWGETEIFLRVREKNTAATNMYTKLGYNVEAISVDEESKDTLLLMKKILATEIDETSFSTEDMEMVKK